MEQHSRGQLRIERALETISKAIQSGQRPGSVLESSIVGNEEEELEVVWSRLETGLEDEGVERQEIEDNKGYIFTWVQNALAAGNLEEKPPDNAIGDDWQSRAPSLANEVSTRARLGALALRMNSLGLDNIPFIKSFCCRRSFHRWTRRSSS